MSDNTKEEVDIPEGCVLLDEIFDEWDERQKKEDAFFWYRQWRRLYVTFWWCWRELTPAPMWRRLKWFAQRRFRGYDDMEIWNLYDHLAHHIHTRLVAFKKSKRHGIPGRFAPDDDSNPGDPVWESCAATWETALDEMIEAFRIVKDDDYYLPLEGKTWKEQRANKNVVAGIEHHKKQDRIVKHGMVLFLKHFQSLWD